MLDTFRQWEEWVDTIRFQQPRYATVATHEGKVHSIKTVTIPPYTTTDEEVEDVRIESLKRYGIPQKEASYNLSETDQEAKSSKI